MSNTLIKRTVLEDMIKHHKNIGLQMMVKDELFQRKLLVKNLVKFMFYLMSGKVIERQS